MSTTRKTAATKTPAAAKKTPARKRTTRSKAVEVTVDLEPVALPLTEAEKQAKLEAYHVLKSAGLDVPGELATEVERWIADLNAQREIEAERFEAEQAKREAELAEANQNGPWFVRNGYPANFNLRLDRQTEKRRIELKPRGTPGDMHPILDEDLRDPILRQNLSLGLIEIIPAGEANLIIEKQTTNMGNRVHTPLAILRNELGQPYQQGAVKVEAEFNSQGVTVAQIDPRVMKGELHDRQIGGTRGSGGLTRVQPGQQVQAAQPDTQATSVVRSGFVPTGGNPASVQYGPQSLMTDNARAKAVDDLARRKGLGGVASGLGGDVQVVVEPVRRT